MLSVHRITNHRHDPAGLQAGIKIFFYNTVWSRLAIDWLLKSFHEHYRYCPTGLRIGVTHHYIPRSTANLTLIGIPIHLHLQNFLGTHGPYFAQDSLKNIISL